MDFGFENFDMGQPISKSIVSGAYSHFCPTHKYDCERSALSVCDAIVVYMVCAVAAVEPSSTRKKRNHTHRIRAHTNSSLAIVRPYIYFIFFLLFLVGSILVFPAKIDLDSDMSLMWWQL